MTNTREQNATRWPRCSAFFRQHGGDANVGQIETAIIRHWLSPRRGSGVFLIPCGRGAVATSLTSSGLETRMICSGDIHTYTLSIAWDAPPLRWSIGHRLPLAIVSSPARYFPSSCPGGRASPARWSIAVWPWDHLFATRNIDNLYSMLPQVIAASVRKGKSSSQKKNQSYATERTILLRCLKI